ncbi:UNVERIFIED_CONTAM: hypothetical protein K2H54_033499 [Gekko kuhli]
MILIPQAACKDLNCVFSDSLSILHKYRQLGDLIIGGIISQIYITSEKGICFDFIERFPDIASSNNVVEVITKGETLYNTAMGSTANVLVVHGEIQSMMILRMLLHLSKFENRPLKQKIWIMTAQMEFTSLAFQRDWDLDFLHGTISFAVHSEEILGFQEFLQRRNPRLEKEDGFIKDFWEDTFKCWFHDSALDMKAKKICTGEEKLETLPGSVFETSMTGHSYSVYNAVYAVAHAVQAMRSSKFRQRQSLMDGRLWKWNQPPWQVMQDSSAHLCAEPSTLCS